MGARAEFEERVVAELTPPRDRRLRKDVSEVSGPVAKIPSAVDSYLRAHGNDRYLYASSDAGDFR